MRSISDESGEVQETYDYDAYGTLMGLTKRNLASGNLESSPITSNSSPITTSEFLFTGELWDADLGMYFLRARYLNTNTGRFHTQDTYEGRNGEPLSLHKYFYANGNPVMLNDPSGRFGFSLGELTAVQKGLVAGASIGIIGYAGYKLHFEESIAIIRADRYLKITELAMNNAGLVNNDGRKTNALLHATASAIFTAEHGKKEALMGMQGRELSVSQISDSDTGRVDALFATIDRHNNEEGSGFGGADLGSYLKSLNLMFLTTPDSERNINSKEELVEGPYPTEEDIDALVHELKYQSALRTATKLSL